ncbi:MAG: FAD-linked oxidase C-terminal domain-containing protein [Vicinamibacterales bacterium]|nr:FAD-linked oxidase C-terminal domain-containing protein [Vicinamibacterales bacterium]
MSLDPALGVQFVAVVGEAWARADAGSCARYGTDALMRGHPADLVLLPETAAEVARIAALCHTHRVPLTVRGAGTGYTGGAVPVRGGILVSMERFNRILEIDEGNQLAVVQANVITGDLQREVEARGLFYPPDPASLKQSALGGNVAENAGGPRAVKYGTTRRYVLALEAVLPTGEIIRTGSKTVKNVVGYDLTQLLVGSEGTLAILTELTLRLVPKPAVQATLSAAFPGIDEAVDAVSRLLAARVVPATIEIIDAVSLGAVEAYLDRPVVPAGTGALVIAEVDGFPGGVEEEITRVASACHAAGATEVRRARDEAEREALWEARRALSFALRALAPRKINHDLVVPRGRVPELFALVAAVRARHDLLIPCFGHAGDGNIHVNLMVDPANDDEMARAHLAEQELFAGVVALEGSISGEHGIGFAKAPYLGLELSPDVMALMARVKAAFDPHGILNPGKMWEVDSRDQEIDPEIRR